MTGEEQHLDRWSKCRPFTLSFFTGISRLFQPLPTVCREPSKCDSHQFEISSFLFDNFLSVTTSRLPSYWPYNGTIWNKDNRVNSSFQHEVSSLSFSIFHFLSTWNNSPHLLDARPIDDGDSMRRSHQILVSQLVFGAAANKKRR